MTIKIDHELAKEILYAEHENFSNGIKNLISEEWISRINELSLLCPHRKSSTFIAALATAILAKCVEPNVDVYCLLDRDGNKNSYSARSLADNVWAKHRALLSIDLGANGANPLNNTPFIGKARIDEIKNVRNQQGFKYLKECLDQLADYDTTEKARSALRGLVGSRMNIVATTFLAGTYAGDHLVLPTLTEAIKSLIAEDSEDGRCAQAVAAGILASFPETSDIEVGHINDPDRNFPLDIGIFRTHEEDRKPTIAVEIKDKPVQSAEILAGIDKSLKFNINTVIYLAISRKQQKLSFETEYERARDLGCNLIIYDDWSDFLKSCIGFSTHESSKIYSTIYKNIGDYLVQIGVSQHGIDIWLSFSEVKR